MTYFRSPMPLPAPLGSATVLLRLLKIELEPGDRQRLAPGSVPFNFFVLQGFMVKAHSQEENILRPRL